MSASIDRFARQRCGAMRAALARTPQCGEMLDELEEGRSANLEDHAETAVQHLRRAVEIAETELKPDEWLYRRILCELAVALDKAGRFSEMESIARRAVESITRHPDPYEVPEEKAVCLSQLARSIEQQAAQAELALQSDEHADFAYRDGERIRVAHEPSPEITARYAEAERVYRDVLAIRLQEGSIRAFEAYRCVAEMLVQQARIAEAEQLLLDALQWYDSHVPIRDSNTIWLEAIDEFQATVLAYARLLGSRGRYVECLPQIDAALAAGPRTAFSSRLRSMRKMITALIHEAPLEEHP